MLDYIQNHKFVSIIIALTIVVTLIWGIVGGLGYISAQRQAFIDKIAPAAIECYKQYGVLPSLTLAQGCLESNFGNSHIENNLFGIKATSSWKGKVAIRRTAEYVNGKKIYIDGRFRAYPSFSDSVHDHALLFVNNSRYKNVLTAKDYKTACTEVWKAKYATDPLYPQKLIKIVEDYNLAIYDEQAMSKSSSVQVKFRLNGNITYITGYVHEDKNYISAREVLEKLGYKVVWNQTTQTIEVTK